MMRMVIVKSAVNATVSIVNPQYGLNIRWRAMGQPMRVPFEALEQALWEQGVRRMFDSGILYIDNMQDKIDLGLEPADATEPVNIIIFTENEMNELLTKAPFDSFKKRVLEAPRMQVDNLIEYAIHNEIVDMAKIDFLKKLTGGKDILAGIKRKRDMREAEEKEKKAQEIKAKRDDGYRN